MKKALFTILLLIAAFPAASHAAEGAYVDGVYEGEQSFVKVRVTIKSGNIADIEILNHGGGGQKYADMIAPLKDGIIEAQSTEVDAVSGATVSSVNYKKAVKDALDKAAGPDIKGRGSNQRTGG